MASKWANCPSKFSMTGERKDGMLMQALSLVVGYDGIVPREGKPLPVWVHQHATT